MNQFDVQEALFVLSQEQRKEAFSSFYFIEFYQHTKNSKK